MNLDDASLDAMLRDAARPELSPTEAAPAETSPAEAARDLAARVRRLRARRRRRRRTVSAVAAVAVVLAGIVGVGHVARQPNPAAENPIGPPPIAERPVASDPAAEEPTLDVEGLRAEIAQLSAEADGRRRIVDELMVRRQTRDQIAWLDEQVDPPDPRDIVRIQTEQAAFLLVDGAEHQSATWPDDALAAAYRQVVEHFPNTQAASVAKTRLTELPHHEGAP